MQEDEIMNRTDGQAGPDGERRLLDLLKDYPMAEATAEFYDQALVRAASEGTRRQRNRWLMTGFGSAARYIRTARSRNSSGYFLGAGIVWSPLVRPI